jgi:hypothetical protein
MCVVKLHLYIKKYKREKFFGGLYSFILSHAIVLIIRTANQSEGFSDFICRLVWKHKSVKMFFSGIGVGCSKNVFWLNFALQYWKFCVRIREIACINIAPENAYSKVFCCIPQNLLENSVRMLWIRKRSFVYIMITWIKCCCDSSIRQGRQCTYTVTMRRVCITIVSLQKREIAQIRRVYL